MEELKVYNCNVDSDSSGCLPEITASYSKRDNICSGFNPRSNNPDCDYKTF
jgi:hypothetical protein